MTTACPTGPGPAVTRDYFHRLPDRALVDLTKAEERVYLHVLRNEGEDGWFRGTIAQIAKATRLHEGTVGPIVRRLAGECPPGVRHPYFEIGGTTRNRRIRVLYRPKDAPHKQPAIRMKNHSNPRPIRMKNHSNGEPETPGKSAVPDLPLFKYSGERNDVDVVLIPGEPPVRTRACEAGPIPRASPPPADDVDRGLAGLTLDQLRERIAELRRAIRDPRRPVRLRAMADLEAAGPYLEALEAAQEPRPTPKVESLDPAPAIAARTTPGARAPTPGRHVETPDLIRRLATPAGASVADLVVGRLCDRLDPEFAGLYRRCCADVIAGRLDTGAMIGGFHWALKAPGFGRKKGPSFAAYIREYRETRQRERPGFHRRE